MESEIVLQATEAKRATLNGARLSAAEQLRGELATLVFTPDRLAVVKGGPAARRAYFDRALGRLYPSRALVPAEYGAAVGQRNASLRRVTFGASSRDALAPWTQRVAGSGCSRRLAGRDRGRARAALTELAAELGLEDAEARYGGEAPTVEALEARLDQDLDRGTTGLGPHLDDVELTAGDRELRRFGSQGEQRLAVLALLLAEAELLTERGPRLLCCSSTTCSPSSTSAVAASSRSPGRVLRAGAHHRDRGFGLADRAGAARRGRPGSAR